MKQEDSYPQHPTASSNRQVTIQQVEKRSHSRIAVSIQVEAVELATGTKVIGTASDLGFGGCFVETKHPLSEGTRVGVRFNCEGSRFCCRALITHTDGGRGMGLVFTEADPIETISVLEWVASVGGAGYERSNSFIDG